MEYLKPYPFKHEGKFWLEPVKGKMNSPPRTAQHFGLPLTEPNQNLNPHLQG